MVATLPWGSVTLTDTETEATSKPVVATLPWGSVTLTDTETEATSIPVVATLPWGFVTEAKPHWFTGTVNWHVGVNRPCDQP